MPGRLKPRSGLEQGDLGGVGEAGKRTGPVPSFGGADVGGEAGGSLGAGSYLGWGACRRG